MKLAVKARITSAVLLGVIGTVAQYFYQLREYRLGREAFLAAQAVRYDHFMTPMHHPIGARVFATVFFIAVVYGLYELIALAVVQIFSRSVGPSTK